MIEVIFKIFLTDYIDFQGFITKRIQKPLLIEYNFFVYFNLVGRLSLKVSDFGYAKFGNPLAVARMVLLYPPF
jgi:hypothetical protein